MPLLHPCCYWAITHTPTIFIIKKTNGRFKKNKKTKERTNKKKDFHIKMHIIHFFKKKFFQYGYAQINGACSYIQVPKEASLPNLVSFFFLLLLLFWKHTTAPCSLTRQRNHQKFALSDQFYNPTETISYPLSYMETLNKMSFLFFPFLGCPLNGQGQFPSPTYRKKTFVKETYRSKEDKISIFWKCI